MSLQKGGTAEMLQRHTHKHVKCVTLGLHKDDVLMHFLHLNPRAGLFLSTADVPTYVKDLLKCQCYTVVDCVNSNYRIPLYMIDCAALHHMH